MIDYQNFRNLTLFLLAAIAVLVKQIDVRKVPSEVLKPIGIRIVVG